MRIEFTQLILYFSCFYYSRWRYCERTSYVGNGCSPGSGVCLVRVHDFLHEFHGDDFLLCLWIARSTIRTGLLCHWFHINLLWTDRPFHTDETGAEKFVHCLFHWRCRLAQCDHDECAVVFEHSRGGTPQLGWNLWDGVIVFC